MSYRNPNKRGGLDILGDILKDTPFAHKREIQRLEAEVRRMNDQLNRDADEFSALGRRLKALEAALSEIRALPDEWKDAEDDALPYENMMNGEICADQLRDILDKHNAG